ncbi:MAG: HD domain-containing protein [Proteobacteria bacterium]|nr:HD domain-containing protein [Pseudomonadota bacterium]
MSRRFIQNLKENESIEEVFFINEKTLGIGKTGKPYISLKLSDKTGFMDGKIWDKVDLFANTFDKEDFVKIKGVTQLFQGSLQLVISDIKKIDSLDKINIDDFMPDSGVDIEKLYESFMNMGESIKNMYLNQLFKLFFYDNEIVRKFKVYPAAKSFHHAYKGGLLEHSLSVARLSDYVYKHYGKELNRDILVFSSLLHDLGKIWELDFSLIPTYTDKGKLLGHIVLLDEELTKRASKIKSFPEELLMYIRHVLLSHHGEYEFGSPKRPKIIEGLVLHFLDNLDAKFNSFKFALEKDNQQGNWTAIVKAFDRQLFKGKINIDDEFTEKKETRETKEGFNTVLKNFNFELFNNQE